MIPRPVHFTMHVADPARAARFYGSVLGWKVSEASHWQVEGLALPGGGIDTGSGPTTIYFSCEDVALTVAKIRALGGTTEDPTEGRSGVWSHCRDNQGTQFALSWLIPEFRPPLAPVARQGELGYWYLPTADLAKAREFYGDLFGWEFLPGDTYAHIANCPVPGGIAVAPGDTPVPYFRVDDMQAALATVRELGGQPGTADESDSGWSVACIDDQGTDFWLWQDAAATG